MSVTCREFVVLAPSDRRYAVGARHLKLFPEAYLIGPGPSTVCELMTKSVTGGSGGQAHQDGRHDQSAVLI